MKLFFQNNAKSILLLILIILGLWYLFAPTQLAGAVSYVIVNGNSMEPDHRLGDLVLTRSKPDYDLNQKVVYQHPVVGYVFHRIVDQNDEGFILKGDNNDWLDAYQPKRAEIVGKYWFMIPGAGQVIRKLREPAYFAGFTIIIVGIISSIFLFEKRDVSRKRKKRDFMKSQPAITRGEIRQELLLFLGILALVALILGIYVFTKPVTKVYTDTMFYTHEGDFSYTSRNKDTLYDAATVKTGDPIYFLITCDVLMDFDYSFSARDLSPAESLSLAGKYKISAQLSDIDGWTRSFELHPVTEFSGDSFESKVSLDVCSIHDLILAKEEKTGAESRIYDFKILPIVTITGEVKGIPLQDIYQPEIAFQFNPTLMRMPEMEDGLNLNQEGFLTDDYIDLNTINIFGIEVAIIRARQITLVLFIISLLASAYPTWTLIRDIRRSDISRIQIQYHPLLVDVLDGNQENLGDQIVEVASFSDLTKMAERYGAMILHESKDSYHRYSVQDAQTVYQYEIDVFKDETLFPTIYEFRKALLRAIAEDQLELYYQPVVLLKDRSVIGVEAFLRWNHPDHGTLYPADFISHAEACDLIPEIDSWVTKNVCQQLRVWKEKGVSVVPVSINISPDTILTDQFITEVTATILENMCDPNLIQIEINRSNQIFRDENIKEHLIQLNDLGVRLAFDNFATDSANQINQIFQMPIQSLKIDRTIIQGIKENRTSQRLVSAIAKMAKSLKIEVVAQGVESKEDLDILKAQDIEVAQGFFLGKLATADEIGSLLEKPD
jgi:signal peptidase I